MKGHLGFRVRPCQPPPAPVEFSVEAAGIARDESNIALSQFAGSYLLTFSWQVQTSPAVYSADVEYGVGLGEWSPYLAGQSPRYNAESGVFDLIYRVCGATPGMQFRVRVYSACGVSEWSLPAYVEITGSDPFAGPWPIKFLTSSSTFTPPKCVESVKIWAIGRGGSWPEGGGGGGLVWKTWQRPSNGEWGEFACVVANAPVNDGNPRSTVTYGGQTMIAYGTMGLDPGQFSGGDGGAYGYSGGRAFQAGLSGITYPFSGAVQYGGNYNFGGSVGSGSGSHGNATAINDLVVSPCRRLRAVDRSGLLSAVALTGRRVTEECVTEAAFGSGGINFTMSVYGGTQRVDFAPGYGGGGFDSTNPGGPGCILVQYT